MRHRPRPERLPQLLVPALADQVQVQVTERGQEPVRVLDILNGTVVGHAEPVLGHALQRHQPREEPVPVVMQLRPQLPCHDRDSESERPKRPEGDPARDRVGAEYGVGAWWVPWRSRSRSVAFRAGEMAGVGSGVSVRTAGVAAGVGGEVCGSVGVFGASTETEGGAVGSAGVGVAGGGGVTVSGASAGFVSSAGSGATGGAEEAHGSAGSAGADSGAGSEAGSDAERRRGSWAGCASEAGPDSETVSGSAVGPASRAGPDTEAKSDSEARCGSWTAASASAVTPDSDTRSGSGVNSGSEAGSDAEAWAGS